MRGSRWLLVIAVLASGACRRGASSNGASGNQAAPTVRPDESATPTVPFEVRAESTDVTYFWFDEHGAPHPASRIDEIPDNRREAVRVDPPRPEMRTPGWVYVADLRTPSADGRYPIRAVSSEQFASALAATNGLAQAMAAPGPAMPVAPGAPPGSAPANILAPQPQLPSGAHAPRITIYGASWCGACHQAASWLRANNIPFVEHDIETEPQAAQEMMARARQQGVPTGSIPIIDINGRLTVGFNPGLIQQALQNPAG